MNIFNKLFNYSEDYKYKRWKILGINFSIVKKYKKQKINIYEEIKKHDIISFDIFDTLLVRPYAKPTDLFRHMEKLYKIKGFYKNRIRAEESSRYKHIDFEDITLEQIYEEIEDKYKPFKEKEMELEEKILTVHKENKKLYDYALNIGKKIIIASDMYLPKDFIEKILIKNGYTNYHKIYLSSDLKLSKASGNLYKYIIDDLNIKPSSMLHIGDNQIPIFFAINNNYVAQLTVTIISILENSDKNNRFIFNILSSDISDENKKIIKSLSYLNKNTLFNFIDTTEIHKKFDLKKFMSVRDGYDYITIDTYIRFFISDLCPQYDKVIYLDSDLIVLDDLQKLYHEDITDYVMGVVQDISMEVSIKNDFTITSNNMSFSEYFVNVLKKKKLKYFNVGVLLLNLKEFREKSIMNDLIKFAEENSPLYFQDQDIMNAVLENKVLYLDSKWNLLKDFAFYISLIENKSRIEELKKCYKKPGIIHYVGENKPWIYKEKFYYDYERIKDWWKYYRKSPLYKNKDELIFKAINKHPSYKHKIWTENYFTYIQVSLFNFNIVKISMEYKYLKVEILFIKITLKIKGY